jgi:predicted nucleic acid-binding protein
MGVMLDSTIWVEHFRSTTPPAVRAQLAPWVAGDKVVSVQPVVCELLAGAGLRQRNRVKAYFDLLDVLPLHPQAWEEAVVIGQKCVDQGRPVGMLDLLIAACAIRHGLHVVTFDRDYETIAAVSALNLTLLKRAG